MLEAGEDARYVARPLVILASEDIGEADPLALVVAEPPPGPSSSSGCPRPSSTWPRPWSTWPAAQSRTGSPWPSAALRRTSGRARGGRPDHLRDAHYRSAGVDRPWRRVRLSPRRGRGVGRSGVPARWGGRDATTSPATAATRPWWAERLGRGAGRRHQDHRVVTEPAIGSARREDGAVPDPGVPRGYWPMVAR